MLLLQRLFLTFLSKFFLHTAFKAVVLWASSRAWEVTFHMKTIFSVLQGALGQQCSTNDHDEEKNITILDSRKEEEYFHVPLRTYFTFCWWYLYFSVHGYVNINITGSLIYFTVHNKLTAVIIRRLD